MQPLQKKTAIYNIKILDFFQEVKVCLTFFKLKVIIIDHINRKRRKITWSSLLLPSKKRKHVTLIVMVTQLNTRELLYLIKSFFSKQETSLLMMTYSNFSFEVNKRMFQSLLQKTVLEVLGDTKNKEKEIKMCKDLCNGE